MKELKYINFYNLALTDKEKAFTNGEVKDSNDGRNIVIQWNDIKDKDSKKVKMGYYLSPMFDTRVKGNSYNRLVIEEGRVLHGISNSNGNDYENDNNKERDVKLEVIVWSTDKEDINRVGISNSKDVFEKRDTLQAFDEWVRQLKDSIEDGKEVKTGEKLRELFRIDKGDFQRRYKAGARDILLHGLHGRYVWVLVLFTAHSEHLPHYELKGMRLEFPKYSFVDYFPEIYQTHIKGSNGNNGNDFFARYIAIFQSMFLDEERKVDDIPIRLDYNLAPGPDVKNLAEWLGFDTTHALLTENMLREMISKSGIFQGKKGTLEALKAMIKLLDIEIKMDGNREQVSECFKCENAKNCAEFIDGGFCIENYQDLDSRYKRILKEYFPLGAKLRRDKAEDNKFDDKVIGITKLAPDKDD